MGSRWPSRKSDLCFWFCYRFGAQDFRLLPFKFWFRAFMVGALRFPYLKAFHQNLEDRQTNRTENYKTNTTRNICLFCMSIFLAQEMGLQLPEGCFRWIGFSV